MLIKLWREKKKLTPEQIEQIDQQIVRFQEVNAILNTAGWRRLSADLLSVIDKKSDIRNNSNQTEDYRKGFCDGIEYLFARIRGYQRSAEKAEQKLKEVNDG